MTGTLGIDVSFRRALLAIAILMGVFAAPALAETAPRFNAQSYPATLKGGGLKTLVTKAGTIECEEATLQGSLAGSATSLSLTPTYGKCKVIGSLPVEVVLKSCYYSLAVKNAGPPYKGSWGIACEKEGDAIEFKVHTETGIVVCTAKVGPQSGLEGLALENTGEGKSEAIGASGEAKGLKYELSGSKCGTTGTFTDGVMKSSATLAATNGKGEAQGAYLSGEGRAQLEAESYPASLKGGGLKAFVTKEGTIECEEAGLTGTLAAAGIEQPLAATYGKCKVGTLTTEVAMNSCRYVLGISAGPPYKGSWGVSCEKAGDVVEFKVLVNKTIVCKASVPPQAGLGGVSLANTGEGAKRAVSLEGEVKGVEYTLSGGYCTNGAYTDGVMKGSSSVAATNGKGEGEGVYLGGEENAPHSYTTTTLATGSGAERAESVPITASGQETTIYSLPVNSLQAGEVLRADGTLEVTNTHTYSVSDAVRLVLGSNEIDANGTVLTPWSSATQTSGTLHLTLPVEAEYRATASLGNQYLKVVLKASSSSAKSGETLKVEPGFGSLAATRFTPAQGPISQPTHKIQPLTGQLPEQLESLPVDSTWRTLMTREVNGLGAEDILDIASQLAVQNTSGTTVQLQAQLTQSAQPTSGFSSASDITTDQLTSEMALGRVALGNALKIDPSKPYISLRVRALPVSGFPSPKPLTITTGSATLNVLRFAPDPGTPSAHLGVGTRENNPYWTDARDVTSIPFAVPGGSEKRVVAHAPIYGLRKGDVINARAMVTGDLGGNETAQVLTRIIIANSPTETTGETIGVFSGDNVTKAEQVHTSTKAGVYVSPEAPNITKYINFVVYASQAVPSGSMAVTGTSLTITRSMPTEPFSAGFEDGSLAQFYKYEHGPLSASTDVAREGKYSLLANMDFSTTHEEPNGNLHEEIDPPDIRASGGYDGEDGWYGFSAYFPKEDFVLGPNDAHFDGKIDEVRIYNQAISQAKVQEDESGNYGSGPSPVAAYSFNEGSGTTAHDSTGKHDGTINGATWTASGKYGSALEFDGKDDEVTIPDSEELDLTNNFTLEAWVDPDTLTRWSPVITKAESHSFENDPLNGYRGYRLNAQVQEFNGFETKTYSGGSSIGSKVALVEGSPPPIGKWSHLAVTSDGTNLRYYINGELVDTKPTASAQQTSTALQIGSSDFSTGALSTIFAQWHSTSEDMTEIGCGNDPKVSNADGVPVNFFAREVEAGEYINPAKTETAQVPGDYLGVTFNGGQISEDCSERITPNQTFILAPLERGRWYDFVLHTKWTAEEAPPGGSNSEVWLDGKQLLGSQTIPVTTPSLAWRLNPANHYKEAYAAFGMYRHVTSSQPTSKLYLDALRRGNSYAEVAPGQ